MRLALPLIAALAVSAAPAFAQGKGKALGLAKGHGGPATSASAAPTGALTGGTITGTPSRQFGSWLDDASLLDPGNAWTSISFGYFHVAGSHQTTFPVVDGSFGVSRGLQVGGSVPYYRMSFGDGTTLRGVGDVTVNAKLSVVDPSASSTHVGMSISTVLEVLETAPVDASRFAFGVPINLEWHPEHFRVFGSTGFYTRGAVFGAGALEYPLSNRVVLTAAMTHMRSIKDDEVADALGLPNTRTDLTGVGSVFVTPTIAVFGGVGRTISELSLTGTSMMVTGGMALTFAPRVQP